MNSDCFKNISLNKFFILDDLESTYNMIKIYIYKIVSLPTIIHQAYIFPFFLYFEIIIQIQMQIYKYNLFNIKNKHSL